MQRNEQYRGFRKAWSNASDRRGALIATGAAKDVNHPAEQLAAQRNERHTGFPKAWSNASDRRSALIATGAGEGIRTT